MGRWDFYKKNFLKNIDLNSKLLLISGSENEINILKKLGYTNINLTFHKQENKKIYKKFRIELNKNLFRSDVRNLQFENNSFEYVAVNATLHHVDLPHKAMTEMYRVASKGVLIIESNDSIFMQIACKMKLAEDFEVSSINQKNKSGGLLDTGIPNYVFRWTEREVIKVIKSYDPINNNYIKFNYASDLTNIKSKNFILKLLIPLTKVFFFIFKKQQNCLSIFIDKTKIRKRDF